MKKFYLSFASLAAVLAVCAQQVPVNPVPRVVPSQLKPYKADPTLGVLPEPTSMPADDSRYSVKPAHAGHDMSKFNFSEYVIGTTRYDLQTNNCVQYRCQNYDGPMHASFTMSFQDATYSDRGTGYNYNSGAGWWDWEDNPTERIESARNGWSNLLRTENGKEIVIVHDGTDALRISNRTFGTSNAWSETEIENPTGKTLLWPHAAVGGADGNSIHLVCITEPIAVNSDSSALYLDQDGALLYYRSQDAGATWDIQALQIEGTGAEFFKGFSADTYAIHARGDRVAIAVFNDFSDTFILTSEDNGDNWEKNIIIDSPVDLYEIDSGIDLNEDGVADTVYNTDGAGAVYIGTDNVTHVAFGEMAFLDDDLTDASWSFFPGWNGLCYWRLGYGVGNYAIISGMQDLDGSGTLELAADGANIPNNGIGLATYPGFAEDGDGNLYLVFSAMVETHDNGDQNFRHIHIINSEDGGDTWLDVPVDVTPDLDFDGFECTFPAVSHQVVGDKLHLIYQRDTEPGLHVAGDLDPADDNDIVYFCITTDLVVEPNVFEQLMEGGLVAYPNPAQDAFTVNLLNASGSRVDMYNALGELVMSQTVTTDNVRFDVNQLAPGVYTLSSIANGKLRTARVVVE